MSDTKPLTNKQQFWLSHIQAAQTSQMTLTDYAQANGLAVKDLYNARWKLKKSGHLQASVESRSFVRAQQKPIRVNRNAHVVIVFDNGIQCQLSAEMGDLSGILNQLKALQ